MMCLTKSLLFFKKINQAFKVKQLIYAPLVSKQNCKINDCFQTGFPCLPLVSHWSAKQVTLPQTHFTGSNKESNVLIVPQCLHCMGELVYGIMIVLLTFVSAY